MRLTIAALVLMMIEYAALGGWLSHVWGINPTRSTPYVERTGKRRRGFAVLQMGYLLCTLGPAAMVCAPLAQGERSGCTPLAMAALLGGTISMLSLFVSIRCGGKRLPEIAAENHGVWLGRTMNALAALSMIACSGAMLSLLPALLQGTLRVQEAPEQMAAYALLMLCTLYAVIPDALLAPRTGSERHIRRIGMGSVLLGCALPMIAALPQARFAAAGWKTAEPYAQAVLCVLCALAAGYVACLAAKGLFARRVLFSRKKPKSEILAPVATVLLLALSLRAGSGYLMLISGAVGFVYVMAALCVCALWLGSVGRRLMFKTFEGK